MTIGLRDLKGFAFDLDGTIWAGPRLLPGASEIVSALRGAGIGVVFASNVSRHGAQTLSRRLRDLGIEADPSEILTAFDLVGDEVRRQMGRVRVLVVGTDELAESLAISGHQALSFDRWREAEAVVVGNDPLFDFDRLRVASRAVAAGAGFFAVNLDARFPVGSGLFDPGCGALAEAVAVAAGIRPVAIGKPHGPLFEHAIRRLGCQAREAAMVGDNERTDILGGRDAGMFTIWLTERIGDPGSGNRGTSLSTSSLADLHVENLLELLERWRQDRASDTPVRAATHR
jgi:4-nitrophenyl phosphatase